MITTKKYLVAKNDWCAAWLIKRINQGRAPKNLLFNDRQTASAKLRSLTLREQEERNVFEVTFREHQ